MKVESNLSLTPGTAAGVALLLALGFLLLTGCTNTKSWTEEVLLSDGRIVEVTQKRRCEGDCIERESWLTINLPETDNKDVTWNEKLKPMLINVSNKKLYVVGRPATGREYDLYGRPEPFYLCFRWGDDGWKRIDIHEVPVDIHDANLVIDGALVNVTRLELKYKTRMNSDAGYANAPQLKRIVPTYRSNFSR